MKSIIVIFLSCLLFSQTANVQIVHNSPYPTVDIYVDEVLTLQNIAYRTSTGVLELPISTVVGVAPAGSEVIASFPFTLEENSNYVVVASGIIGDQNNPFDLKASTLDTVAVDENSFALKVMHGVTDAPAVDIYANGSLLIENLSYGEFQGYLQIPPADYILDVTAHGSTDPVASFYAPLTNYGSLSGLVYASGFLSPADTDSIFSTVLTTPAGYTVQLPNTQTALQIGDGLSINPNNFEIGKNYPNPFNPTTTITYDLSSDSKVSLSIFDIYGKEVSNLVNESQSKGSKFVIWDSKDKNGNAASSGIYFYRIGVDGVFVTKQMTLLK
tara:strand:- start:58 stop:1041 length:984 start_codon:yes stop_codon:yes gene_type:complete